MQDAGPWDDLDAAAHAAAVRGSLLFHLFLAERLAAGALSRVSLDGLAGWAVDVGADGYEVSAVGQATVLRRVTFAADGSPLVETPRPGGYERQALLARAREAGAWAAADLDHPYAVVVAPPPRDVGVVDEVEVMLIRTPERPHDLAAGPHWRLRISTSDGRVLERTAECGVDLVVPDAARLAGPGLVLPHAEAATPSAMHVLLSLQHGFPFDVVTAPSRLRWRVDGERLIRL